MVRIHQGAYTKARQAEGSWLCREPSFRVVDLPAVVEPIALMPKRRHRGKPEETQKQQWKDYRRRCRGPEWGERYTKEELRLMQERGRQLREGGYGSVTWNDLLGER